MRNTSRLKIFGAFLGLTLSCVPALSAAVGDSSKEDPRASEKIVIPIEPVNYRGWDYLVHRLIDLGVDEVTLRSIYQDPRIPEFTPIPFSVAPREHRSLYSGFTSSKKLELAKQFLAAYERPLRRAHTEHKVSPHVIAAILLVESGYGKNTGKEMVLNRLSRLSALGSPENIEFNYDRLRKTDPTVTREKLRNRAEYLETTFTPEILALLKIAKDNGVSPLEIRGSYAGAFGIPQFLPSSYLTFAVDGNGDKRISLYDPEDAIFSAANFLEKSGWKDSLTHEEKRKVIWKYNKSDEYITAILAIASRLEHQPKKTGSLKKKTR